MNVIKNNEDLAPQLQQTRIWLQEMLCLLLGGITFEGFLRYCDAYDLDASELLEKEAKYCNTDPIEVDWAVAIARDIWERAGYEKEQLDYMKVQGDKNYGKETGIDTRKAD